jgi:hypothetical protein
LLSRLKSAPGAAVAAILLLAVFGAQAASADPCVQNCRVQHNFCRMKKKLLLSPRCDSQLQSCLFHCFRGNGGPRGHDRDRDHGHGHGHGRGFR